jgi:hypothetical protein
MAYIPATRMAAGGRPTSSARASSRCRSSARAASSTTRAARTASCARRALARPSRGADIGRRACRRRSVRICSVCGAGHFDRPVSRCATPARAARHREIVNNVYRIENVDHLAGRAHHRERRGAPAPGLRPADHLPVGRARRSRSTCGTVHRGGCAGRRSRAWPTGPAPASPDSTRACAAGQTSPSWASRIDPISGYWAKNDGRRTTRSRDPDHPPRSGSCPASATTRTRCLSRPSRVTDLSPADPGHGAARAPAWHRGRLSARGGRDPGRAHALARHAQRLPLYEATEGGAGVLTRLVSEPTSWLRVARKALQHDALRPPETTARCRATRTRSSTSPEHGMRRRLLPLPLMSYYNQPDHELVDRRDEGARALLRCASRLPSRVTDAAVAHPPEPAGARYSPTPTSAVGVA